MTDQTHTLTQSTDIPTTVIDAEDRLKPLDAPALWAYRELFGFLVWREITVRYKQAALGIAWMLLQPLAAIAIYTLVFSVILEVPSGDAPYVLFVFSGLLPWRYFVSSVGRGAGSLVNNAALVSKVYFPRLIIPVSSVIAPLVDFLISFSLLFPIMLIYDYSPLQPRFLLLPVFLFLTVMTGLSLTLWLSALNVRYRDVGPATSFLLQLWFYITPVVYPTFEVPENLQRIFAINPMVGVIEGFRWAILDTESPDFIAMGISVGVVGVLLVSGLVFFSYMERSFGDVI